MKFINTETLAVVPYEVILAMFPKTSFPIVPDFVPPSPFVEIRPSEKPAFDWRTQQVREGTPVLVDGAYVQGWEIVEIFDTQAERDASIAAADSAEDANRISALWQGAYNYEFAQISGVAIGLLVLGVLQSLPKALAVKGWSNSIWSTYYTRKAGGSSDTDYSVVGECPHTVPELMAELGL